ncbi:MAG: conjugal transfer protein TraH [Pseudomonadota bacterium]|nr:conjugal transfer protein TraH [Pseudomonadota bacterium]
MTVISRVGATFAFALVFGSCAARAGIGSDVQDFFDEINYANVTAPGVYEGQSAGYFTGGGLYTRTPIRNYSLLNVQMPRFRAGCGGIDLYSGGFSFINADQFTEMLRNIGSNATSLAFMLALQVVSPQINGVLADIYDWAQKANNAQINSCEAAGAALGGALGLFGAKESGCVVQRMASLGEDYHTADANCRSNPNDTGTPDPKPYFTHGNLAWKAMMPIDFFRDDLDLAQAVMNLTGTVIVSDDGSADPSPTIRRIAPQLLVSADAATGGLVDALLHGGSAAIYQCADASIDETSCMDLGGAPVDVTIASGQAIVPRVRALLSSIADKIRLDTPLSAEELGLIRSTTLPVHKYLTVSVALLGGNADTEVLKYAEIIGKDLLYAYLLDLLRKVASGTARLGTQSAQDLITAFQQDIRDARHAVMEADAKVMSDFNAALALTTAARDYERALVGHLSPAVVQSALFQARQ